MESVDEQLVANAWAGEETTRRDHGTLYSRAAGRGRILR